MSSELWQRLREVRKFAKMTQGQMAQVVGVTRSGYAFWENSDSGQRTRPNVEQAVALCKRTGVSVEWLLSDKSDINDLWRNKSGALAPTTDAAPAKAAPAKAAPAEAAPAEAPPPGGGRNDRAEQRFWAAAEYIATAQDKGMDHAFGRTVRAGAIEMHLDYMRDSVMAVFTRNAEEESLLRVASYLLAAAKLAKLRDPSLKILVRSELELSEGLVESCSRFLGVHVFRVTSPDEAAAALLAKT